LAPKRSLDKSLIAIEIEIALFMKFLLDLDFLAIVDYDERPRGGFIKHISSRAPITKDPHSAKYTAARTMHPGFSTSYTEEHYTPVGEIMQDRIDGLCKQRLNNPFTGSSLSLDFGHFPPHQIAGKWQPDERFIEGV
jgi:hypothetical protein